MSNIYLMESSIDLNVDSYTQEDLLSLLDLNDEEDVTHQDILDASNPLINRYTKEDDYDLANFFQGVQNRLLQDVGDVEVALVARAFADADRFISKLHVQCRAIHGAVHRNRADAEFTTTSQNS